MLIGWSPHQASDDPRQPAAYLLDRAVAKTIGVRQEWEVRTPAPELLLGHPSVVQSAIAALRFRHTTRTATLSFDRFDIDVTRFNASDKTARRSVATVIDLFLEVAFAGVPVACRPPAFVGTHTHTGSLEINIVMPRFVWGGAGKLRSYSPHPPMRGSQNTFDALGDFLNAAFDWANPRAPERALAIKGPDWAEKRVAAAQRYGVKFTPDVAPQLFLLQAAKMIASSRHGQERSRFLNIFRDVVAATRYEIHFGPGDAITLISQTDPHPLLLRGTSLAQSEATLPEENARPSSAGSVLSKNWQRRAAWNASEYSNGVWTEPEPDWAHLVRTPRLQLPSCHPECLKPVVPRRRSKQIADRLATGLREMRARVSRMAAEHMISSGLRLIDLKPFSKIKNKLEIITDDITHSQSEEPGSVDGGALRAALSRFGERNRNGYGAQGPRPPRRNDRDQGRDGAAHRCAGTGRSYDQNSAAAGPATTDLVGKNDGDLPRYYLDQRAALARPLRAIDVIRVISNAASKSFPQASATIGMGYQGDFRLAGADWEIILSFRTGVTGAGEISAQSYRLFVHEVSDRLGLALIGPAPTDAEPGSSPF